MHWKAGAGSAVITPGEPMWLAGWAVRTEPARGTAADLFARALALEDAEGHRVVVLAVDLIAVTREIVEAVARTLHARFGLSRAQLVVVSTHTHSGPEVRPDKVLFFHIPAEYAAKIGPYVAWLTTRLVEAAAAAIASLRPARLFVDRAEAGFAHNRRGAEACDRDVPVLAVNDDTGKRIAVVFGYACHNTTMPPDDARYCGDYAGFAAAALEAAHPGLRALFLAGAGADQDPSPRGTLDLACDHGRSLACAVERCLAQPETACAVAGTLGVAYDEVPLAFQPLPSRAEIEAGAASDHRPTRAKAQYLLDRLDEDVPFAASYPCPIQVVRLGGALLLVALGGEPVVDYARAIKACHGHGRRLVWVAGYAGDMFGYVPTASILREGGYEGGRSLLWSALPAPFTDDSERQILGSVDRLVQSLNESR